jgi:hypothetical protein
MGGLLALILLAVAADPVEIVLKKEGDQAVVSAKGDHVTIAIESATGIGRAVLRPGKKGWPKHLRLDIGIKGLEGFTIHDDRIRVQSFLGSTMPEVTQLREGKWESVEADRELVPTIRKVGERMQIEIPSAWLDPASKELSIQWIDFYRN